jgi:hypothetical protein
MMREWVTINGAKIERSYFEENVREAKSLDWSITSANKLSEHAHCIVCGQAIEPGGNQKIYQSKGAFLDQYCFEHFVSQ